MYSFPVNGEEEIRYVMERMVLVSASVLASSNFFSISTAMAYDPALQWNRMFTSPEDAPPEEPDLRYITEESALLPFTVLKNSGSPDTNVALVKRKVHAGQKAFCEFLIEKKGDEFLVGITNNGSTIRSLSGRYSLTVYELIQFRMDVDQTCINLGVLG